MSRPNEEGHLTHENTTLSSERLEIFETIHEDVFDRDIDQD